jgi:methionine synthase II (cobalamin-independent)
VFATLAGPYPLAPLDDVLTDQLDAGLGIVADGRVRSVAVDSPRAIVEAWSSAADRLRVLAAERELEVPTLKACLVGPYGAGWADGGPTMSERDERTLSAAAALRSTIDALRRAGAGVIQVDESAMLRLDDAPDPDAERALIAEAWRRLLDGCRVHVTLAILGGSPDAAGPALLFGAPFASYLFDLILGPDAWRLAAKAPGDRGLIVGVADCRTDAPDAQAVMVYGARYASSLGGRGPDRVGLAPSARLETRSREVARAKIEGLAAAASTAVLQGEALARSLDPRAVDARSAALGRFEARRRRVG